MKNKKIMILGMSPMPFENDIKVYGTGIRTWQFAVPLLQNGHRLCIIGYAIPSAYPEGFKSIHHKSFNTGKYSFEYHMLEKAGFEVGIIPFMPQVVGQKPLRLMLGKNSGSATIEYYLDKIGMQATKDQVKEITDRVKYEGRTKKKLLSEHDFANICKQVIGK